MTDQEATMTERLMTIKEVAKLLAVCTRTVRRMLDSGKLDPVRFGRRALRFKSTQVLQLMETGV